MIIKSILYLSPVQPYRGGQAKTVPNDSFCNSLLVLVEYLNR